ncbi:MAG: DNA cytosine methyltransferase [Oscillospiraceae bacterium]|nr:DNA cytosine methyltransferase [Oscillospiraceae bacterium]
MKVIIACEESQKVCKAFRALGHEAYSCDLIPESGGCPQWHIQADATQIIKIKWDLIIAHPPCTYLTASSAIRLFNPDHTIKDATREEKGWKARSFFFEFLNADCPRICIENPAPLKHFHLPEYSQIIEPYMFGDPWKKRTCLWLKGLPPLVPTDIVEPKGLWVGSTSGRNKGAGRVKSTYTLHSKRDPKIRSKTFPGIARAMAEQWGGLDQ